MTLLTRITTYEGIPLWRHVGALRWAAQIASAVVVVTLVVWFFANIVNAIQDRQIPHGFSFLQRAYQTPIGQHFLPYDSSDSFLYALVVASTNTVIVAVAGVALATMLGIVIGVARLSNNWILSSLSKVYIEFFRNVPLLVQLFFWFYIVLELPPIREGYVIGGNLYINNRGITMPWPAADSLIAVVLWLGLAVGAVLLGAAVHRMLVRREISTGKSSYPVISGIAVTLGGGALAWLLIGMVAGEAPLTVSYPEEYGAFGRLQNGFTASAGLLALLIGLVMYTAAFIAEIVRAGIQSVGRGQFEASRALGLSPIDTLRHVTFPQALRVIIPPLISQCLNLTKNSSLGGAIGYSELTNVAKTMTQTAPAVSIFLLIMAAYLAMSLSWSLVGNLYNRYVRIVER